MSLQNNSELLKAVISGNKSDFDFSAYVRIELPPVPLAVARPRSMLNPSRPQAVEECKVCLEKPSMPAPRHPCIRCGEASAYLTWMAEREVEVRKYDLYVSAVKHYNAVLETKKAEDRMLISIRDGIEDAELIARNAKKVALKAATNRFAVFDTTFDLGDSYEDNANAESDVAPAAAAKAHVDVLITVNDDGSTERTERELDPTGKPLTVVKSLHDPEPEEATAEVPPIKEAMNAQDVEGYCWIELLPVESELESGSYADYKRKYPPLITRDELAEVLRTCGPSHPCAITHVGDEHYHVTADGQGDGASWSADHIARNFSRNAVFGAPKIYASVSQGGSYGASWNEPAERVSMLTWYNTRAVSSLMRELNNINFSVQTERERGKAEIAKLICWEPYGHSTRFAMPGSFICLELGQWASAFGQIESGLSFKADGRSENNEKRDAPNRNAPKEGGSDSADFWDLGKSKVQFEKGVRQALDLLGMGSHVYGRKSFEEEYHLEWRGRPQGGGDGGGDDDGDGGNGGGESSRHGKSRMDEDEL